VKGIEDVTHGSQPVPGDRNRIVFYGAGSLALVLNDLLDANGYRLVAMFSDDPPARPIALSVPIIVGGDAIERWLADEGTDGLSYAIAIGNRHRARLERCRLLLRKNLQPATLIHPMSFISPSARVGAACQILALAFLGAAASIGDAVILNAHASVDHECRLGDAVYVGPGAVLAGEVQIGTSSFIGAGAIVLPGIRIAADVIIGAGAVVTENIEEPGTYVGVPARRTR
jgi:sugar O-acyltransferase (sialic acid O-acetyltransferase NeuD family)